MSTELKKSFFYDASSKINSPIPNGVFLNLNKKTVNHSDCCPINIVMLARFVKQKNHMHLLRSLIQMSRHQQSKFQISLFGDGPLQADVAKFVVDNNLSSIVHLYPSTPDIRSMLSHYDYLILTSLWRDFPYVY